jgi:hypothetical protein
MEKDLKIKLILLLIITIIVAMISYPHIGGAVVSSYFIICLIILTFKSE